MPRYADGVTASGRAMPVGLFAALDRLCPGRVRRSVSLAGISRWKVGGPADLLVEPQSAEEISGILQLCRLAEVPLLVVGDTSNLLFADEGFRGVMMQIGRRMAAVSIAGTTVTAQAGVWMPYLAATVGRAGLSGIEHTAGIPGTLGGLVMMNGGSQRRGIGEHVSRVWTIDERGEAAILDRADCRFAYRRSAMQDRFVVITAAELVLERGDARAIRRTIIDIMASRRRKFPLKLPNCGSVFLSDPAMYATVGPPGHAIEQAGLKGLRAGQAQISPLHANFIVNLGGATARDILTLIGTARSTVFDRTGFWLNCEVRHVGPDGTLRPAHEMAPMGRVGQPS
jgi:UDP-N-acetylmuramate dehydrogenase